MATQIVELTGDEAKLLRSLEKVIQKQLEYERKLKDTGEAGEKAGTAIGESLSKVEKEANKAMFGMIADLRKLGPDGEAAAAAVKKHLATVGGAGTKSINEILASMEKLDPASAEIAKGVAEGFKSAATATGTGFTDAAEDTKTAWDKVHEHLGLQFTGLGVLAGGLATSVTLVSQELERQQRLIQEGREAHLDVAGAQQEAFKNLAGFRKDEQLILLEEVVSEIQKETGFQSRKDLTLAVGAAGSADAKFEEIPKAVRAAARVTALKPDEVDEFTMAAVNIGKVTGLGPEEAINLLLTAGGKALVKDPGDVAKSLPTSMLNTVNNAAPNVDRKEEAISAAALYGLSTDAGGDTTGQSSQTNVATVTQYLDELWQVGNKALNKELETTEGKLKAQEEKVKSMQAAFAANADAERQLLEKEEQLRKIKTDAASGAAEASLQRERDELQELMQRQAKTPAAAKAKSNAIAEQQSKIARLEQSQAAKVNVLGSEQELRELRDQLAEQKKTVRIEEAQKELEALKQQKEALDKRKAAIPADPGDLLGRLKAVQSNEELKAQYLSLEGGVPGEKAFKSTNRDLADADSKAYQTLLEKRAGISGGRGAYDLAVEQVTTGTLSTRIANADARTKANTEIAELGRPDLSLLGQVRETTEKAMSENQTWFDAVGESFFNNFITQKIGIAPTITSGRLLGTTAAEEGVSAIREMGTLRDNLADPQAKARLDESMQIIANLIIQSASNLDPNGRQRAVNQIGNAGEWVDGPRTVELLEKIESALQGINRSNAEMNLKADRQPNLTPALSEHQT